MIDLGSGTTTRIQNPEGITELAANADASVLLLASDATVRLWDVRARVVRATVDHASAIAIDPDGQRFATGGNDGTVRIWSATGRLIGLSHTHRGVIDGMTFSANGDRLLVEGRDGVGALLDVAIERRSLAELAPMVQSVPWRLADGQIVAK